MLDSASETDEEGNPRGDINAAESRVYAAKIMLESAESGLTEANIQLEGIDREKRETISELNRYTEGESRNLAKLEQLQGKRFGGNANAFIADLVARMNSGEAARDRLLKSLGQAPAGRRFNSNGAAGTYERPALGGVGTSSANVENEFFQQGFFGHLKNLVKGKRKIPYANFGVFPVNLVGDRYFIAGKGFDAFLNDWHQYGTGVLKTSHYDEPKTAFIDSGLIENIWVYQNDIDNQERFWSRGDENKTEDSIKEIARLIPEVKHLLGQGVRLEDIIEDSRLGVCASIYFSPQNIIKVIECDGYYEFQGDGRHRVLAARSVGVDIPVEVVGERHRASGSLPQENSRFNEPFTANDLTYNDKRNQVIASALVEHGLSSSADFGALDSKTSRDVFDAVIQTKQMFPDLNLKFIGSAQARNRKIETDLQREYMSAYKRHYPGATEQELIAFVQQDVSDTMRELEIGERTIAVSLFVPEVSTLTDNVIAKYNGISINENYGKNYEEFVDIKKKDVAAGWKPIGCDTPKATVDHELGHQIAKLVSAHNDPEIQRLFKEFIVLNGQDQMKALSGYAATNIHEFIAECWSESRNNPECRDCAKFVANKMIELYEAGKQRRWMLKRDEKA